MISTTTSTKTCTTLNQMLQVNKLSPNVAKTQCLVIGSRKRLKDIRDGSAAQPALAVSDENISIVENIKYLGAIVDRQLSWDEQLSAVTNKVSRGIGMLRFSKKYLPIARVQNMYRNLIEPYFRYGCLISELQESMLSINCKAPKQSGKNCHKKCL